MFGVKHLSIKEMTQTVVSKCQCQTLDSIRLVRQVHPKYSIQCQPDAHT